MFFFKLSVDFLHFYLVLQGVSEQQFYRILHKINIEKKLAEYF